MDGLVFWWDCLFCIQGLYHKGNHGSSSGAAPKEEFIEEIRDIVTSHKLVYGIHDLIVHDYGPGRLMISLHAEVDAEGDIQGNP